MRLITEEAYTQIAYALQYRINNTMLDHALIALQSAPEVEVVGWKWRCKPYCEYPKWVASLGKRPADYGVTPNYEDAPLYATKDKT